MFSQGKNLQTLECEKIKIGAENKKETKNITTTLPTTNILLKTWLNSK